MSDIEVNARLFRAAVAGVALAVSFFPGSPVAKVLLKGRGPVPRDGETLHHFSFRQSLFFLAWSVVLAAIAVVTASFVGDDPSGENAAWLAAIWICGLVAVVMLAGCAGHAIRAAWEFAFRRDASYHAVTLVTGPVPSPREIKRSEAEPRTK